jgi:hypothetical protein
MAREDGEGESLGSERVANSKQRFQVVRKFPRLPLGPVPVAGRVEDQRIVRAAAPQFPLGKFSRIVHHPTNRGGSKT